MEHTPTAQQNQGYDDYYDVEYPRREIHEPTKGQRNPEHPKPKKPLAQDIYDEDGYSLARFSSKLTDDNRNGNIKHHNKQTAKEKQTTCFIKKSVCVPCFVLFLIAIFGIVGHVLHQYLYGEGEKDIKPGTLFYSFIRWFYFSQQ